ncbi:MAG: SUMF1/EgtB/PvdO family nonheme iron enzyme, partial [Pseudomonadota bacterium]
WRSPGYRTADDHPVTLVCHKDAEAFCEWLSKQDNRHYELPTEARWEFAARGGLDGRRFPWGNEHPGGNTLNMADVRSPVPWAERALDDGHARTAPVGAYSPNGYWLYDMAGNVWELCSDYHGPKAYDEYRDKTTADPTGPRTGKNRVVRGGNWAFGAGIARNSFRFGVPADVCMDITGFRVCAEASQRETPAAGRKPDADSAGAVTGDVGQTVEQVKNLVAEGRRMEAGRLAARLPASQEMKDSLVRDPSNVVKSLLDSLIDLTPDKRMEHFTNSLEMKMVRIPAGSFVMGSSESDIGWAMTTLARGQPVTLDNEYPFHKVRISRSFYLSATEVTVAEFRRFIEETGYITDAEADGGGQVFNERDARFERKDGATWRNPGWKIEDSQPVVMVSYYDAEAFLDWLTAKEKLPYKLPTEAQWEYAARGGIAMGQFPWGDDLPDGRRANFADKNTDFEWRDRYVDDGHKYVAPVGTYEANDYGLYDMAGNVLEWVRDHYSEDYYRYSPEIDPEGPGHGETRVSKGGEWTFGPVNLRCAFRGWSRPDMAFYNTGFRVAVDLAGSRRAFHFANDFLTKAWAPGPDQREVAQAVAREKERRAKLSTDRPKKPKEASVIPVEPSISGVAVLDFTPKSDGKKAGIEKGDVIIEYDGVKDLTVEKLLVLYDRTKRERVKPSMVIVRDGVEYNLKAAPGILGIAVMNTRVRGPFKKPARTPEAEPRDREPQRDKKGKPQEWT